MPSRRLAVNGGAAQSVATAEAICDKSDGHTLGVSWLSVYRGVAWYLPLIATDPSEESIAREPGVAVTERWKFCKSAIVT